jgi:hypothetical protein
MARNFGVSPNVSAVSLTIAQGAALSEAYDYRRFFGGHVMAPATWTAANIGFQICDTVDGTFVIACDKTGVPIQISGIDTGVAKSYAIPTELFPVAFVKLWSKDVTAATTTSNNQAGARAMKVLLK